MPSVGCAGSAAAEDADVTAAPDRLVLVDAMNLAYWCGRPPSLRVPLAVCAALRARAQLVRLIFDASARYRLGAEAALYLRLLDDVAGVHEVPSGRPADRELLRQARAQDALLLSRDRFRDHRRRYRRLIDDPARVFGGFVAADQVHVPALALRRALPATPDSLLGVLVGAGAAAARANSAREMPIADGSRNKSGPESRGDPGPK